MTSPIRFAIHSEILVIFLTCSTTHAAAGDSLTATSDGADESGLPTVTITARRVAEDLQTTGASVVAFDAQQLSELHVTEASDLQEYVANLELKPNTGSGADGLAVKIRGIGESDVDFLNADPSVATYVDGVFQARPFGPQFYLFDIQQVEILRGPQGTLYGKNALGGAINITTEKPDGSDKASAAITGGNYSTLDVLVHAQTSLISSSLFGGVSFLSREHDAYYTNLYESGVNPGNEDVQAARASLRWIGIANLTMDFVADYTRQNQNDSAWIATEISPTGLSATALRAAGFNPAQYAVGPNPTWSQIANVHLDNGSNAGSFLPPGYGGRGRSIDDATFKDTAATITWGISPTATLRSVTGFQTFDRFLVGDADGTPAAIVDELDINHGQQITEELQADAKLFDGGLQLTGGAFFLDEQLYEDESNGFLTGLAQTVVGLQDLSTRNVHRFVNQSQAAFAHAVWSITDDTRITSGIRYTHEHKNAVYLVGPLVTPNDFSTLDETLPLRFDSVTPLFEVEHNISKSLFGYASASKGYASGGYNDTPSAITGKISTYRPETLWNYELGFKGEFLERRLRVNAAGFLMNYRNIVIQTYGVSPGNAGVGLETTNAGRARVTGTDVDLEWRATERLTLTSSFGELNQTFLDYGIGPNGLPINPSTAHFFDSPGTTASVRLAYSVPLVASLGALSLRGDWSHRARTWFDNDQTPVSSQSAYALYNARIQFTTPSGRLSFMAFGDNLGNQVYMTRSLNALVTPFALAAALYGPPRTYGIQVSYHLSEATVSPH